jgi:hypothetical protein
MALHDVKPGGDGGTGLPMMKADDGPTDIGTAAGVD